MSFSFDNDRFPRTYRDINYLFPLFMNLFLLLNGLYFNVFRVQKEERPSIADFATVFLYAKCNYVCFEYWIWDRRTTYRRLYSSPLHIESKIHLVPILTYAIFFILAALILFIIKLRNRKKNKRVGQKSVTR